jgi:hypothetical protein
MTRIIKSLLGRKQEEPSLEDIIAYNTARMALQVRVEQMSRQNAVRQPIYRPTTDAYGHAL